MREGESYGSEREEKKQADMEGDVDPRDFIGTQHAESIPVPGKTSGVGFEEVYEDGNEDSKIKATHFPI